MMAIQLVGQLALSFVLLVIGTILSAPPLKDIHWKTELKER